ncbi:hypothetical protein [Treponema phagedenis]|uniref:Uncharacterized protein n=1 Tax=Treponema phagedenis TaxID=162 RepID=A0AAE6IT34_TREPH|nr:hypothetical protein [Treponema phagedenis]QEJ97758.1 hypothetical protein FUT82_06950 [Treponema phagedenis]QEK03325.1 hypothetical protein FUT83_05560 [Treponema phagedenis]QEK08952.1 hypothetical protein FUT81_05540 [Treponema phagedenis]
MKKTYLLLVLIISAPVLFAHTPLLTVEDNGDGTIYVQGGFSNGASAAGVKLYLTDKNTGEKLWDGEFPAVGEIDLEIPAVPYTVTFDAGPGHVVVKDGPLYERGADDAPAQKDATENGGTVTAGSVAAPSASWVPMDTVSAMPSIGPSFTAIAALCLAILNLVLILFLFRKIKNRSSL